MTPTIVLKEGKPFLALGSPGGPTIINTVLEVMVNVIDFRMNVQDAVNWPRFHHQWMPDELRVERGYSPDTIVLLQDRGYTVKTVGNQGECAAILFDNGWLEGAPDPRTEGTAARRLKAWVIDGVEEMLHRPGEVADVRRRREQKTVRLQHLDSGSGQGRPHHHLDRAVIGLGIVAPLERCLEELLHRRRWRVMDNQQSRHALQFGARQ